MFKLTENGTNVRTEIIAGLTTFATMSYIIIVQPVILTGAFPENQRAAAFGAIMVATCIASAVGTLLMGLWANYPIALAPAMGHNVFFVLIVTTLGIPWQYALGAVAISGTVFILVSAFDLRERIVRAVPKGLRNAIAAGIGLLIALIGFEWAKIVVPVAIAGKPAAPYITLGSLHDHVALLALIGLAVTTLLMVLRVRGAILIGIVITAVVGALWGVTKVPEGSAQVVSLPPSIAATFLALRLPGLDSGLWGKFLVVIFVFFFLDLFDTVGTLIGVSERGGFMKDGELPRAKQALLADAVATVTGAGLGTSTVTSYIESTTGIAAGGRTGLANVVTAVCFLGALFFFPFFKMVGSNQAVVAPALMLVGALMMTSLKSIDWDDLTEAIPCFLTIALMAFTFSITEGISFGFISYSFVKLVTGRGREVSPVIYVFSVLFILFYVFHPLM